MCGTPEEGKGTSLAQSAFATHACRKHQVHGCCPCMAPPPCALACVCIVSVRLCAGCGCCSCPPRCARRAQVVSFAAQRFLATVLNDTMQLGRARFGLEGTWPAGCRAMAHCGGGGSARPSAAQLQVVHGGLVGVSTAAHHQRSTAPPFQRESQALIVRLQPIPLVGNVQPLSYGCKLSHWWRPIARCAS